MQQKSKEKGTKEMNGREFRDVKDKIFYRVINTELNRMLLDSAPSIELPEFEMSKVFYVFLGKDELGARTLLINNPVAEMLGYSVEELNHFAEKNTFKLFPSTAKSLMDIMQEMLELDMCDSMVELDKEFFVLSNRYKNDGAHAMFNRDFLDGFAESTAERKLYILPVSEHETLLVRGSQINGKEEIEDLKDCLKGIADSEPLGCQRLSYQCIIYNVESRQYSVA